ncbi:drug/metabolite transporter superfamily [Pluteus cervinus]|uniref:Drug/metabolite transporter superfamily n=1 Tax=Pluteus cervinus TaxID=181527 RepID=A0ACD3ADJ5_9AGAR|nr:drug/metabolite transporter superfamily [Pluteus cervinus]
MDDVREVYKNNVALLLVAAAQAFFSLMNVAVKGLNEIDPPVPTMQLIFVRMIITYVCSTIYMKFAGVQDPFFGPKGVRLLLAFRGFSGFFGLFGIYYSLQYLSLSDATVLTFLAPLCTAAAGAVFLKEKFGYREALAGVGSLIGVVLIARPASIFGPMSTVDPSEVGTDEIAPTQRLIAVGVSMLGVLGATGAYTSMSAIGKRAHPLHSMASFSAQCVIVSTVGMIVMKTPIVIPTQLIWLAILILIGIFGFVAQLLLTMGMQRESAGRASIAVYTQVIFATILEQIFFHTTPSVLSVLGTVMILTSALYVAGTKQKRGHSRVTSITLAQMKEESLEEGLLASHSDENSGHSGHSTRTFKA